MTVTHSCEYCDKEFNLHIKLKKHILADHNNDEEKDMIDFTKKNQIFSDDEKALYFADLKSKYLEEKSRLESLKEKCKALQNKLASLKRTKSKRKSKHRKMTNEDFRSRYDIIDSDYSIPEGWLSASMPKMQCNLKSNNSLKMYLSPDGKACMGRRRAIRHMIEMNSPEADIALMKLGLFDEGWEESNKLPDDWLFKHYTSPDGKSNRIFSSNDYKYLSSPVQALKELVSSGSYNNHQITMFICAFVDRYLDEDEITWKDYQIAPINWKFGRTKKGKNLIITSEGQLFKKIRLCLKSLEKSKQYDSKTKGAASSFLRKLAGGKVNTTTKTRSSRSEIKRLRSSTGKFSKEENAMEVSSFDGYKEVDFLPSGWTAFKRKCKTPDGQILSGFKEVVPHMLRNNYSEEDINKYKETGTSIPFKHYPSLPSGWMTAVLDGPKNLKMTKFLSPDGELFMNRASSIKFMIEKKHKDSDIEMMKELLAKEDGWEIDDNLPSNWMKREMPNSNTLYLSPTFDSFRRKRQVINFMKENGYDEEDLERTSSYFSTGTFKYKVKSEPTIDETGSPAKKSKLEEDEKQWKTDSDLPPDWTYSVNGEEYLISNAKGDIFKNRKEAIDFMIKNEHPPTDIFKLWNNLHLEGWNLDDKYLPSGWRKKYSGDNKSYKFLSPMMETMASADDLLEHITNSKDYSDDDAEKLKLWISESH